MRYPVVRGPEQWSDPNDLSTAFGSLFQEIGKGGPHVVFLQEADVNAFRSGKNFQQPGSDAVGTVNHAAVLVEALDRASGDRGSAVFGPAFALQERSRIREGETQGCVGNIIGVRHGILSHPDGRQRDPLVVSLDFEGFAYDVNAPTRHESRSLTIARWIPNPGEHGILLATTTLELSSPELKQLQLRRCTELLRTLSDQTGCPVLFGGHLNIKPYDRNAVPALGGLLDEWSIGYPPPELRTPEAESTHPALTTHRRHNIVQAYLAHDNSRSSDNATLRSSGAPKVIDGAYVDGDVSVSQHRPLLQVYQMTTREHDLVASSEIPTGTRTLPLPSPNIS